MIKTIPLDLLISFVIGAICALSAAEALEKEESMFNTYFFRANIITLTSIIPLGIYLANRYTAWSWMYYVDPGGHSRIWTWFAVSGYYIMMVIGFHVAYINIKLKRKGNVYIYIALSLIAQSLILLSATGRFMYIHNDYSVWFAGKAPGLWQAWKGGVIGFHISMTITIVWMIFIMGYFFRKNRADIRRMIRQEQEKLEMDREAATSSA